MAKRAHDRLRSAIRLLALTLCVCAFAVWHRRFAAPPVDDPAWTVGPAPEDAVGKLRMRVTGYCNCGLCCGWRRDWLGFGEPVYDYGKLKGKPKRIGITAKGTVAKHGTVAVDPEKIKFGTKLYVPGYGIGVAEDIGGAISGNHIDLWFATHGEALAWGSRELEVLVLP